MNDDRQDIRADELNADPGLLIEDLPSIDILNEFYRANGWDADYRQITPGPFRVQIAGRLIDDISLFREASGPRIAAASQSPDDCVSVILGTSADEFRMSGYKANHNRVLVVPPGFALSITVPNGGEALTVDIPEAVFREFLQAVTGRDSMDPVTQIASFTVGTRRLAPLHQMIKGYLSVAGYRRVEPGDRERLVTRICGLLHHPASKPIGGDPYRRVSRDRVIRRAKDYIHAHLADNVRVPDLCRHSGVSLRTLERAFKREIGVTPNQYLKAARLHAARHELQSDEAMHLTVADIALKCGFTHMGRFSQIYRRHFGVLPSKDRAAAPSPH